jgi:hypothetical protein
MHEETDPAAARAGDKAANMLLNPKTTQCAAPVAKRNADGTWSVIIDCPIVPKAP